SPAPTARSTARRTLASPYANETASASRRGVIAPTAGDGGGGGRGRTARPRARSRPRPAAPPVRAPGARAGPPRPRTPRRRGTTPARPAGGPDRGADGAGAAR